MEEFDKPKIVYQELSQGSSFALDEEGEYFVSNTGYLITGNDIEYIIHMLNSRVIEYCFRLFYSISLGDSGLRWLSQYIMNLPLPKLSYSQKETLLTSFHNNASISHNITVNDNELSICKLFGFTKEEIAQIFITLSSLRIPVDSRPPC
ncbi:MAG: TaqI-like C-terminal specificity domain-containing protein [Bacteroidales bacterium]|nr:TaqI-like C-terminal specificity domain-containing protein [Bacteroidales bacterium]